MRSVAEMIGFPRGNPPFGIVMRDLLFAEAVCLSAPVPTAIFPKKIRSQGHQPFDFLEDINTGSYIFQYGDNFPQLGQESTYSSARNSPQMCLLSVVNGLRVIQLTLLSQVIRNDDRRKK